MFRRIGLDNSTKDLWRHSWKFESVEVLLVYSFCITASKDNVGLTVMLVGQ